MVAGIIVGPRLRQRRRGQGRITQVSYIDVVEELLSSDEEGRFESLSERELETEREEAPVIEVAVVEVSPPKAVKRKKDRSPIGPLK